MPQRIRALIFDYQDQSEGKHRAIVFCSEQCGVAALEDPPESWDVYRHQVPRALLPALVCHGCGFTLEEVAEDAERFNEARRRVRS